MKEIRIDNAKVYLYEWTKTIFIHAKHEEQDLSTLKNIGRGTPCHDFLVYKNEKKNIRIFLH